MPDSNTLIAVGTIILAIAAVITAIITVIGLRHQSKDAKAAIEVDVLLRLDKSWRSPRMIKVRASAAASLLDGSPGSDVDEVLDFLESIALSLFRGVLEEEITWHIFCWPMANYGIATRNYVCEAQQEEGTAMWSDLPKAVKRLEAVEARKTSGKVEISHDQNVTFLDNERSLVAAY